MSQVDPAVSSKCSSGWTVDWAHKDGWNGRLLKQVPIISHKSWKLKMGYYPILSLQYYPKLVSSHFWGKLLSKWVFSELFWTSEKQLFPQTPISQGQPECLEAGFIVLPRPQSFMIPSQILHESAILKKNNTSFKQWPWLTSYIIILYTEKHFSFIHNCITHPQKKVMEENMEFSSSGLSSCFRCNHLSYFEFEATKPRNRLSEAEARSKWSTKWARVQKDHYLYSIMDLSFQYRPYMIMITCYNIIA